MNLLIQGLENVFRMVDNLAGPAWLARLTGFLTLVFAFLIGGYVAGCTLHDPDTCWLLALGQWIVDHCSLPSTDPFSFTYQLLNPGQAPVYYQWLAEVVFALAYKTAGLIGLEVLVAVVLTLAFVSLPWWLLRRCGVGDALSLLLVAVSVVAASFHFLARPEIFSYICLSVLFLIICFSRSGKMSEPLFLVSAFVLMVLWSNLHTGFITGLVVILLYASATAIESALRKKSGAGNTLSAVKMLGCSALATLCTPWGIGLWSYIPHLFFMKSNRLIVELRPVSLVDPSAGIFYPFIALMILVLVVMARRWRKGGWAAVGLFAVLLMVVAIPSGLVCRRLIPFAALFAVGAVASMFSSALAGDPAKDEAGGNGGTLLDRWQKELKSMYEPIEALIFIFVPGAAAVGALFMALYVIPPKLPQTSLAFPAPYQAIEFLSTVKHKGRILNDPQFGDMMIWREQPILPVFIDTRFDMYGDRLIGDYLEMIECRGDWQRLLDKYGIDLIFLPPRSELVKRLAGGAEKSGWSELYRDESAVILSRTPGSAAF